MIVIDDVEQGSNMWLQLRLGIPTASCFDKIITSTGKTSTQRKAYQNKLLAEWITGEPSESYKNEWMEIGNVREGDSRLLYEMIKDTIVQQVGLVYTDDRKLIAASPDGLTENGGFETKCPKASTHVEYLLADKIPTKYKVQIQGSIWVCERDYWDFMSYYPEMPPLIIRVNRDTKFIKAMSEEIECFVEELLEKREQLEKMK